MSRKTSPVIAPALGLAVASAFRTLAAATSAQRRCEPWGQNRLRSRTDPEGPPAPPAKGKGLGAEKLIPSAASTGWRWTQGMKSRCSVRRSCFFNAVKLEG
jgi:hypothetical protein